MICGAFPFVTGPGTFLPKAVNSPVFSRIGEGDRNNPRLEKCEIYTPGIAILHTPLSKVLFETEEKRAAPFTASDSI